MAYSVQRSATKQKKQGVCFSLLSFLSPVEYSSHCRILLFKKNLYKLHSKVNNEEGTICIEEREWGRERELPYIYVYFVVCKV